MKPRFRIHYYQGSCVLRALDKGAWKLIGGAHSILISNPGASSVQNYVLSGTTTNTVTNAKYPSTYTNG